MTVEPIPFAKGHGTENDFVVLEDLDATRFGQRLDAALVRRLCDRRAGVGADGVLRVVAGEHAPLDHPAAVAGEFFMDFYNADGSRGEMCGNGTRVFAHYLHQHRLVDPEAPLKVGTRAGIKVVERHADDHYSVDMGPGRLLPGVRPTITLADRSRSWPSVGADLGNPHTVVFVDDLADAGDLIGQPTWDPPSAFPQGVNIEFVVRTGQRSIAIRIHERGVGETRSCGTGACAAVLAAIDAADQGPGTYEVTVPGGHLVIDAAVGGRIRMTGPAVLVAEGRYLGR